MAKNYVLILFVQNQKIVDGTNLDFEMQNCVFSNQKSMEPRHLMGGFAESSALAIYCDVSNADHATTIGKCNVSISESIFKHNHVVSQFGALLVKPHAWLFDTTVAVRESRFQNNHIGLKGYRRDAQRPSNGGAIAVVQKQYLPTVGWTWSNPINTIIENWYDKLFSGYKFNVLTLMSNVKCSLFEENSAAQGGAVAIVHRCALAPMNAKFVNVTFSKNTAFGAFTGTGGAVWLSEQVENYGSNEVPQPISFGTENLAAQFENVKFLNNKAIVRGGGVTFDNVDIFGNAFYQYSAKMSDVIFDG